MKPFSFVHGADLHLDSPFTGVTAQAPDVAEALRAATFEAFQSLIQLCLDRRPAFLLLAGDVYDGADRSLRAQLRFRDGLATLAEQGIRSFVVHGNHDPLEGWSSSITWPPEVHVFGKDTVETVTVEKDGSPIAAVSGVSYGRRRETRNLAQRFSAEERGGLFQIALLHCNCGANADHEAYAPCSLSDLQGAGFDYWALGHVHEKAVLTESPYVVYPGNTQGRHIREQGERGCYWVTVNEAHNAAVEFCALDAVRWLTGEVRIDDFDTIDRLERGLAETVETFREHADGRSVVCRIALAGRGPLYKELRRPNAVADLLEHVRERFASERPFVWLEAIEANCRPEVDLAKRRKGTDLLAQVLNEAGDIRGGQDLREALAPVLDDLFEDGRARKALDPLGEDELRRVLDEAELLCLDMLEGEGEE